MQKKNYRSLHKFSLSEEPTTEFKELQEKYTQQQRSLFYHRHNSYSSTNSNPTNVFKSFEGKSFLLTSTQVTFYNL